MKFFIMILLVLALTFSVPFVSLSDENRVIHPQEIDYQEEYEAGRTFGTLVLPYIELFGQPEHKDIRPCENGDGGLHYHIIFGWFVRDSKLPPHRFNMKVEFIWWPEKELTPDQIPDLIPEVDLDEYTREFINESKTRI